MFRLLQLCLLVLALRASAWPLEIAHPGRRAERAEGQHASSLARRASNDSAAASPSALALSPLPRLSLYYQTTHDQSGQPISMLPLVTEQGIALTHLIVCSFHVNYNGSIHLNDYPPDDAHFATLWNETAVLRAAGVRILGMVGGAAAGSFSTRTLDSTDETVFEYYYGQLHDVIATYSLQGMDLDVEQSMSQDGISRLVSRLYEDFGADFEITLAPVASALRGASNLSGFSYALLEAEYGADIAFYNAQFYNGFGSLSSPSDFEAVVAAGYAPSKVLLGEITTPSNGYGYVSPETLNATVVALRDTYGSDSLGGIMGWEYFNSQPGGTAAPWEWAQRMTEILRPGMTPSLTITSDDATRLDKAYEMSSADAEMSIMESSPKVNYRGMVNS